MTAQAMKLQELAAAAPDLIRSSGDTMSGDAMSGDTMITGLAHDSRTVEPGDLFFCVPGANHDGHRFASDAVARGAACLVVERSLSLGCPEVETASVRRAMGPISSTFYGHPSRSMTVVGITGTNGKTTVSSLLGSAMTAAGCRTEVLGTLSGTRTTPESLDLQRQLACWKSAGVDVVAMEVSSHALHQHRVDGIRFDAAVFTNLTPEHLDYHATTENYFAAKARLFTPELADRAVVNRGDGHGALLAAESRIPTVVYDPQTLPVRLGSRGLTMRWRGQDARLALVGRFNAANALAAAEAALLLGAGVSDVVVGLESAAPVPGRFEVVALSHPFTVVVDYAHTPDGLAHALAAARELVTGSGRLRLVFGCGGDRDPGKRPMMGRVAAEMADQVIVTSDNPRSEDPEAIIADVFDGIPESPGTDVLDVLAEIPRPLASVSAQPDRRAAIGQSLADAVDGDVVVVAGKGHETTQTAGGTETPFDDRVVIQEILTQRVPAR